MPTAPVHGVMSAAGWASMKIAYLAITSAALVLIAPTQVRSAPILDQELDPSSPNLVSNVGNSNVVDWAQTFTVGQTGQLTSIEVWVNRETVVTQPMLFDVRTTTLGSPTLADSGANILAAVQIPASSVSTPRDVGAGSFVSVDLSSFSLSVTTGEILAIVLRSDDPGGEFGSTYGWVGLGPGTYSGGTRFLRFESGPWELGAEDFAFRTFVEPIPEPGTAALFAIGLAALGIARSRRFSSRSRAVPFTGE
jgi:hypothetical protein